MRIQVRLFGGIAARAGVSRIDLDVPDDATAAAVLPALAATLPATNGLLASAKVAVNLDIADGRQRLAAGDEIAVLPPVAGGSGHAGTRDVTILTALREPPLPVEEVLAAVASPAAGATCLFVGTVRDHSPGFDSVERLEYSAYHEMAEATLRTIAEEIVGRWPQLLGIAVLHAVGDLPVGAPTVVVACSAPHREEAFAACRHALEEVKRRVPVWKREVAPDGDRWVGMDGC